MNFLNEELSCLQFNGAKIVIYFVCLGQGFSNCGSRKEFLGRKTNWLLHNNIY